MSDSVRPHRRQPTRLPHPGDSPGKNTGVGCHFLLQCMKGKSESEVAQSCPTPSDSMDCSPPGSSVHGIFQARVLEWGAIAFSMGSSKWCELHVQVCRESCSGIPQPLRNRDKAGPHGLLCQPQTTFIKLLLLWRPLCVKGKPLYSTHPPVSLRHWFQKTHSSPCQYTDT